MNKRKESSTQSVKRNYVSWNGQMDEIAIRVLKEQIKAGNKGEGDYKPCAYQAVADALRNELQVSVTADNVKNRAKSWKKHYAQIIDIRKYTKLKWDEERKMIVVTTEDLTEWDEYVKNNPTAAPYRNKSIEHWEDICIMFGEDRALGVGAEQYDEAAIAMEDDMVTEAHSSSKETSRSRSKKLKRDRLADAVTSFADSFKEYVQSKMETTLKPSGHEVYEVVSKVEGILRHQVLRAVKAFLNLPEEFKMLKDLPEDEKLDWILLCLKD